MFTKNKKKLFHDNSSFVILNIIMLVSGLFWRIYPLFDHNLVLTHFATEDGYLMLTIARNISIGNGMTVADGTISTNGTQPLFAFIQAFLFWLVEGDKIKGIILVQICQVILSILAAGLLFILIYKVLEPRQMSFRVALFTASIWYASSRVIPNTMNCLETSLYTVCILGLLYAWYQENIKNIRTKVSFKYIFKIGFLMGLTFWARNDAIFLITSLTIFHFLISFIHKEYKQEIWIRFLESFGAGSISLIIALPWLIYNKLNFGSIVPISGTSQSFNVSFGHNFLAIPASVLEYITIFLPIPSSETNLGIFFISSILVIGYCFLLILVTIKKMSVQEKIFLYPVSLFCFLLIAYYGFFYGAIHFLVRYLFPISVFAAMFTVSIIFALLQNFNIKKYNLIISYGVLFLLILSLLFNFRAYYLSGFNNGMYLTSYGHFQVVNWVQKNVPESTWVGAYQTGTLGFFHDKTINLDGKVNPYALQAKMQRKLNKYIVEQTFDNKQQKIEYLIDWIRLIKKSIKAPSIKSNFELIVEDYPKNLGVLKRK